MTTVAFRDGIMVADTRGTHSDAGIMKCTKLFRKTFKATARAKPREHILGICGDVYAAMVFVNWYGSGKPRLEMFDNMHESEEFGIMIWTGRKLFEVNRLCTPVEVEDRFHAIGSGAAYAIGAMASGKSALDAVRIACRYDGWSGLPAVSMSLKGSRLDANVSPGV
jgi:hypothetical protein